MTHRPDPNWKPPLWLRIRAHWLLLLAVAVCAICAGLLFAIGSLELTSREQITEYSLLSNLIHALAAALLLFLILRLRDLALGIHFPSVLHRIITNETAAAIYLAGWVIGLAILLGGVIG